MHLCISRARRMSSTSTSTRLISCRGPLTSQLISPATGVNTLQLIQSRPLFRMRIGRRRFLSSTTWSSIAELAGSKEAVQESLILEPHSKRPKGHWKSVSNQRLFLLEIGEKIGIGPIEFSKWYKITHKDIIDHGGAILLKTHNFSFPKLLSAVFPEFTWEIGKFAKKPQRFWKDPVNERKILAEVASKLGIKDGDLEAWYKFTGGDVAEKGGKNILKVHNDSLSALLKSVYPDHNWERGKFPQKPRNFWTDISNQKKALLEIGPKLGINEGDFESWYKVSNSILIKNGGAVLIHLHRSSLSSLLKAVFPEHNWDLSKFSNKPQKYWKSPENQRAYMDEISLKLGIEPGRYERWYEITNNALIEKGGGVILEYHMGSISKMVSEIYKEHKFDLSKFAKRPKNYWQSLDNQRGFMDGLGAKFGIGSNSLEKWYRISNKDIISAGGSSILEFHGFSKVKMLRALYPDHDWDERKFASKPQSFWQSAVTQRQSMDEIGKRIGIKDGHLGGWYGVTARTFRQFGGSTVLSFYNGSLAAVLQSIYPEHLWDTNEFRGKSRTLPSDDDLQREETL